MHRDDDSAGQPASASSCVTLLEETLRASPSADGPAAPKEAPRLRIDRWLNWRFLLALVLNFAVLGGLAFWAFGRR